MNDRFRIRDWILIITLILFGRVSIFLVFIIGLPLWYYNKLSFSLWLWSFGIVVIIALVLNFLFNRLYRALFNECGE